MSDESVVSTEYKRWSPYGAPWLQTVATGRKFEDGENARNRPHTEGVASTANGVVNRRAAGFRPLCCRIHRHSFRGGVWVSERHSDGVRQIKHAGGQAQLRLASLPDVWYARVKHRDIRTINTSVRVSGVKCVRRSSVACDFTTTYDAPRRFRRLSVHAPGRSQRKPRGRARRLAPQRKSVRREAPRLARIRALVGCGLRPEPGCRTSQDIIRRFTRESR
jgi:hypothetical protein